MGSLSASYRLCAVIALVIFPMSLAAYGASKAATTPKPLRLIPFPKQVKLQSGRCPVSAKMVITVQSPSDMSRPIADIEREISSAVSVNCAVKKVESKKEHILTICLPNEYRSLIANSSVPNDVASKQEGYCLRVMPNGIVLSAKFDAGFQHGFQTIVQLIRANMNGKSIPCMTIIDWPSMVYRGYSDDITRGPSPALNTLKSEVAMSSLFKMNFFTYYMEYQYQFSKHPQIGPKDGSLSPQELRQLINYANGYGIDIIGCQQSFGHFEQILKHDEFKDLQENPYVLNPLKEETYRLLDDMYSEQAPIIKSKFFNVGCDETIGLGEGASKEVADKIGVGALYANHIKRIHDIITSKYKKRMMMWGDIILNHPDSLNDIPKDTIMLAWNYEPMPSYAGNIVPFRQAGFDFFVCPGTNSWLRILPDFNKAVVNIQNFVRDGAKLGAMGMLNTTWDDDGQNPFPLNWHGLAWGAECSWNASATDIKDFNRRIGGVLFGESGDHFGQAVELIEKANKLPGYEGLMNSRFWQMDNGDLPVSRDVAWRQANALLNAIEPAIKQLNEAKRDAKVNQDILDCFIFAAERVRVMALRQIDFLDAARIYQNAYNSVNDKERASKLIMSTIDTIRAIRDEHEALRERQKELWERENRPYYMDVVLGRYNPIIDQYDKIVAKLISASRSLTTNGTLPPPNDVGFAIKERGVRYITPEFLSDQSSAEFRKLAWADNSFGKRIGIIVESGNVNRINQPIEVNLPLDGAVPDFFRLYDQTAGNPSIVPMQVSIIDGLQRLLFIVDGKLPADTRRVFMLYYMPQSPMADVNIAEGVSLSKESDDRIWMENEHLRLLIGSEGGHIYRWEIKPLNNLDITAPGETDWLGFADSYWTHRSLKNHLEVIADGDVMSQVRCTDTFGMEKTITLWRNTDYAEVTYNSPCNLFGCYDNIDLMGAQSSKPGYALFSDGYTEKLRPYNNATSCQIIRDGVRWSAKYNDDIILALITPEIGMRHIVGPGGGMGGIVIENGPENAHFIIYGGICPASIKETLDGLADTLDFTNKPKVALTVSDDKKGSN